MSIDQRSQDKLLSCDKRLQDLFVEVSKYWPVVVIEGHRGEAEQNAAFAAGKSKLRYPNGKHNSTPSQAVDVAPYPIDWNNSQRMIYFAGFVLGIASLKGIDVRWGGDWSGSLDPSKNTFKDLVHFEVKRGV